MSDVRVALLGGFDCMHAGQSIPLPLGAQRLLALLALHTRGLHRSSVRERLWPDSAPQRASANLRSALWRSRTLGNTTTINPVGTRLELTSAVTVDLRDIIARVHDTRDHAEIPDATGDWEAIVAMLGQELLPNWSDDWILMERERWDHLRLHTLDQLGECLKAAGHFWAASQTARAATAIEPIRENAHRLIIQVYMNEGNPASALKHYQHYRRLLQRELGAAPSARMDQLVQPLMSQ